MAMFPATKLCPAALTNPGTKPCQRDLDAAQPAWGMAEKTRIVWVCQDAILLLSDFIDKAWRVMTQEQ